MNLTIKNMIWRQFGASIDTLENAITACPDHVWGDKVDWHEFWYLAYHTLFFLDYYLSETPEGFAPPPPFGLEELDPAGVLPPRVYSRQELLAYLAHCRAKSRKVIGALSDEKAIREAITLRPGLSYAELYLYTMRHVQHHSAQLNLLLRQRINSAPGWVSKAKVPLTDD